MHMLVLVFAEPRHPLVNDIIDSLGNETKLIVKGFVSGESMGSEIDSIIKEFKLITAARKLESARYLCP
jgi:hypothetical protein